jgi:putative two-component system response regulator
MAERITLGHHERWSGGGYPLGIGGEEIPVEGRIMNIADQYDALRSRRPYKPPFDHETAFRIITQGDERSSPSHFDPMLLEIFKDVHVRFRDIFDTFRDANPDGWTRHAGKGNHPSSEAAGRSHVGEGSSFR